MVTLDTMTQCYSDTPRQHLPKTAYVDDTWFKQEQEKLFSKTWQFACMDFDLPETGDYTALKIGNFPIFVIRNSDGELEAFHNLCRHRGTELVEGKGNSGKTIVCPYHRWTYMLDGQLRGLPNADHFPNLNKTQLSLKRAGIGIFKEMVFVHPSPDPAMSFEDWLNPLNGHEWPHEISTNNLQCGEEFIYRINCNWKVFYENAIDGYHLAYLHDKTLGGPLPDKNVWEIHGLNLVWYSTERDRVRNRVPKFVEDHITSMGGVAEIEGAQTPGYGGVYMLFPTTLVTPTKWSITISRLEPISASQTILKARTWMPKSWFGGKENPKDAPGFDNTSGEIISKNWTKHPLETGDFQTEDIWVCEKMQRSLNSPEYSVGPLAQGAGSESTIDLFQRQVLELMN